MGADSTGAMGAIAPMAKSLWGQQLFKRLILTIFLQQQNEPSFASRYRVQLNASNSHTIYKVKHKMCHILALSLPCTPDISGGENK